MRLSLLLLSAAFCGLPGSSLAQADSSSGRAAAACEVIATGLTAALRTSTGLHIVQKAEPPWAYFEQLPPERRRQLLDRVQASLQAPDSLLQRALAQRGSRLPNCSERLDGTVWLQQLPEELGDTSVVTLKLPVMNDRSDEALVYVGWSNRWVGQGAFYLLQRLHERWSVARTASAWEQ